VKQQQKKHRNKILWFVAVPFILFLVLFRSPLGLARDWDLGAVALVWLVILVHQMAQTPGKTKYAKHGFLLALAFLSLSLQIPWFFIHQYEDRAVRRYEDILKARPDLQATSYGYEILGRYYHDQRLFMRSLEAYKSAAFHDPDNYRHYRNIAMESINTGDIFGAIENLNRAYDLSSQNVEILIDLAQLYHNISEDSMALITLKQVYTVDSTTLQYQFNLGCAYFWNGRYEEARSMFQGMRRSEPDHYFALMGLVDVAIALEEWELAESMLDTIVTIYGVDNTVNQKRYTIQNRPLIPSQ
jgi:tetratricopeptide (TPR) repeat protein